MEPPERTTTSSESPSDATEALLQFLDGRDQLCPVCRYNLRDLTRPECPECHQLLELAVGVREPRIGWFLAALAPSVFSGIAAALLLVPIIVVPWLGGGAPPAPVLLLDAFGWFSGLAGTLLIFRRFGFMRLAPAAQRTFVFVTWLVHVLAATILFVGALL